MATSAWPRVEDLWRRSLPGEEGLGLRYTAIGAAIAGQGS